MGELTGRLNEARVASRAKLDAEMTLRETEDGYKHANSQISALTNQLEEFQRSIDHWQGEHSQRAEEIKTHRAAIDAMGNPDENEAALMHEMQSAESRNTTARAHGRAMERHEHRQALVKQHEADEDALKAARAERAEMVASIEMPVEGLAIVDGAVRYGEHPFSQAAESKRLEIGVAIGAAQDPALRLMRVEHGSLLDSKALAHLGELAEKYDMQVLVEKVADSDTGCGLYIENGRIAER